MAIKLAFILGIFHTLVCCSLKPAAPKTNALEQSAISGSTVKTIKPVTLKESPLADVVQAYAQQPKRTIQKATLVGKKISPIKQNPNPDLIPTKTVAGKTELIISASLPLSGDDSELGK